MTVTRYPDLLAEIPGAALPLSFFNTLDPF